MELATSVAAMWAGYTEILGEPSLRQQQQDSADCGLSGEEHLSKDVNFSPASAAIRQYAWLPCRGCDGSCSRHGIRKMLSHPPYAGEPLCDGGLDLGIPQEGRPGGRVRF